MFTIRANNLDDPNSTLYHGHLIRRKKILKNVYRDFYVQFKNSIGTVKNKKLVELGSGGGFIKDIIPNVLTSDILKLKDVDMQFSALKMPFKNSSIDAFFMIDVMHHIKDAKKFFTEMQRCLKKGGKIIMVEPASTFWGGFIYKNFHHELFDPKGGWKFRSTGPMSSSNLALPWIVFFRDKKIFQKLFPELVIEKVEAHTPFLYLLSGGLTLPQLVPSWTYPIFSGIEKNIKKLNFLLGMFYTIELKKK